MFCNVAQGVGIGTAHATENEEQKSSYKKQVERVNWNHLAHDRETWQNVLNTVIILWVPKNSGNFWTI
jgi:hypothetical protein